MPSNKDPRIRKYVEVAHAMKKGSFNVAITKEGTDEVAELGAALEDLARSLDKRFEEMKTLSDITAHINSGMMLDDVLNHVYESFRPIIPFDRIGCALIEENGKTVRSYWARSDAKEMIITKGYSAPLKESSLHTIMETGNPRIINNLKTYLVEHPHSDSTEKIVREGMRSSFTCPLNSLGKPIGFLFFSSVKPDMYAKIHQDIFIQIAHHLSAIVEKSRYLQQLLELNELKNKFLGMAAHDLRNPLSTIKGYLELFLADALGELTDDQREVLIDMNQSSDVMLGLINDLLDVTAIETGNLQLKRESTEIGDLLHTVQVSLRVLAHAKSIEVNLDFPRTLPLLHIDQARIKQVLTNLITNALKYSFSHTTVTLSVRVFEKELWIAVKDEGQGIPVEEMKHLFKDFSRTSVKPTAGEKSIGLGLAITRRIVEAHGGIIWVDSVMGKGSTFTFSLPLTKETN
jgi:signal transduction histidine kinase